MFSQKYFSSLFVFVITAILFFTFQVKVYCQRPPTKTQSKIYITYFASKDSTWDLDKSVYKTFKKVLEEKGLYATTNNNYEFLIHAKRIGKGNKIALSVVELQLLTKEAVEAGKKAEVFYANVDKEKRDKYPAEGKFIREKISEDYLNQFRMVWANHLDVIDMNDLESYCKKIAAKYL